VPFDADEVRPWYRGATLAPWPNRVVDGRYTFAGVERRLALTEPDRGHALHGLAGWLDYVPIEESSSHVTLSATIEPQTPWVQIHTADQGVGNPGHRTGLAVEPMTCAPDAFNADSYDYDAGLIVLDPGESTQASWRIAALARQRP